jgi:hypothetical protein
MVADQNLFFEFLTSDSFQAYAHFMRPDAAKHLPCSSTTLRAWILEAYKAHLFRVQAHFDHRPPFHACRYDGGGGGIEEL